MRNKLSLRVIITSIAALRDKLAAEYPIDPKRIHATGMSNGAMMTHRLGIELSDRLAVSSSISSRTAATPGRADNAAAARAMRRVPLYPLPT